MLSINIHNVTKVETQNEDTFSVVRLFVDGENRNLVTMFFRADKADAVAEAINKAIKGEG